MGEVRPPTDTTEPTTQAGRISDAIRARMRLHQAWFEAHPNQPMPEGRDEVERLIAAIEAEARDATGLRDLLIYRCDPITEDGTYLYRCARCHASSAIVTEGKAEPKHRPECPVPAALAAAPPEPRIACCPHCGEELSAAPPEPRWPSRDELGEALHEAIQQYTEKPCSGTHLMGYGECQELAARVAALREGGERP